MRPDGRYRLLFDQVEQLEAFRKIQPDYDKEMVDRIYLNADLVITDHVRVIESCEAIRKCVPMISFYLALPAILRDKDEAYLEQVMREIREENLFAGVLCGNLEGIGYFTNRDFCGKVMADASFYMWNHPSWIVWTDKLCGATVPLELHAQEQRKLLDAVRKEEGKAGDWDKIVYGYLPLMLSANCVAKTSGECRKEKADKRETPLMLKDRMGVSFPIITNCMHCFNVVCNSVPLSLHGHLGKWKDLCSLRLQFTVEDAEMTKRVLKWYFDGAFSMEEMPFSSYTNGHEKKGVL